MRPHRRVSSTLSARRLAKLLAIALSCTAPAFGTCIGDCDADGNTDVVELVRGITIALGDADRSGCPHADGDGDFAVTVDDLVSAVDVALTGCQARCSHKVRDAYDAPCRPGDPIEECIAAHLERLLPGTPPPTTTHLYHGEVVYYVPVFPECCDWTSWLFCADGKILCAPDGGFDGDGDGRCNDFSPLTADGFESP